MRVVRRHLRLGVATWLMCHVLAFSALLPRDCCAAHAHGATVPGQAADPAAVDHSAHGMPGTSGHEHHAAPASDTTEGAQCPMRGADGTPCPMHGGGAAPAACQMTGVCNQPAAALAAVLMQAAVPPAVFALVPREAQALVARAADEQPHTLAVPPDSPPPRL
jgi:hypothetical protein